MVKLFQLYPEIHPSLWFQFSRGNYSPYILDNFLSSVQISHSSKAVDKLVMASTGQKRAASDTDELRSKVEMHLDQMVPKGDSPTLIPLLTPIMKRVKVRETWKLSPILILITLRSL